LSLAPRPSARSTLFAYTTLFRSHARLAFHAPFGVLGRLLDGGRHLVGLAVAVRDPAPAVADDDEGVEAEATAALDDGGAAADLEDRKSTRLNSRHVATWYAVLCW